MKKFNFLLVVMLLLMGGLVTISSCKKDDDSPSKTKMISGKNFYVKSMKIDPPVTSVTGVTVTDLYPFTPDCVKDNFITYNENGTFVEDEGASKCEPGDPQTINGTWEFLSDETQLMMTYDTLYQLYNLDHLTNSILKLSFSQKANFGEGEKLYHLIIESEAR